MPRPISEEEWNALPISNDFIFSKVMADQDLCKDVVELLLDEKVGKVQDFQEEKSINITHDSKTVRLDVYLRDESKVVNVEMQVANVDDLRKRSRYYQSLIDLGLLESGHKYTELPTSYVIFICMFDIIGNGKARNSYQNRNDETGELLEDGTHKIYYNTTAIDKGDNQKLIAFLEYVGGQKVSEDPLVQRIEDRIKQVKSNKEWRTDYMKFEIDQQMREEKAKLEGIKEGKKEGIKEGKKEGIKEGKKEGIKEGKKEGKFEQSLDIARNLLGKLDFSEIARVTGLPLSEVEKLRGTS